MAESAAASRSPIEGTERSRRLVRGITTSALARVLSVCSPLVVIPLALDLMGPDSYGVWVTMTAITGMLLWADLGLGNGLMTQATKELAIGNRAGARQVIASAYAMLGGLAITAIAVLITLAVFLPWGALLNSKSSEASAIAVITLGAFILNVPLSLIQRVQYSLGEVALSNVLLAGGPVLTILGALAANHAHVSSTKAVVLMTSGPIVASVLATIVTIARHRDLVPMRGDLARGTTRSLLALGTLYLTVQVLSAVALNADNLIIAQVRGAAEVVDYSIIARLFMIAGLVISLANLPLWPANAEALARGDVTWVRRTTLRMTWISGGCMVLVGTVLVVFAEPFVHTWVGPEVEVPRVLLVGFALLWTVVAVASPAFMVANSQAKLRPQLFGWSGFLLSSILLKLVLAQSDVELLPLAAAGLYLVCLWPAAYFGYRQALTNDQMKEAPHGHHDEYP